jgi:hypothetical protein
VIAEGRLQADAEVRSPTFARLSISSGEERAKVELGVDWRKNKPILLAVGPVLHADDARLGGEDQPRLTPEGSYRSQPLLI